GRPFADISPKDWSYGSVNSASCYDLMNGRGKSEFAPNGTLTVAESITLAVRIHAKYYGKTIPSYDGGAWYDGYVSYALQNGIYADGPYDIPATREVFARILAAALPEKELWDNGSSVSFADEDQIRYRSSVELLCQAGVINGTKRGGQTFFDPNDTITRAQAAAIITRMVIPDNRTHS
ncbi:MAG: S-layer homology domain-containing protein, partial [Oscillospiraceae bacterium]|nr:S-layer homology domain-containing protein [Oscillospiraceae bacterium]